MRGADEDMEREWQREAMTEPLTGPAEARPLFEWKDENKALKWLVGELRTELGDISWHLNNEPCFYAEETGKMCALALTVDNYPGAHHKDCQYQVANRRWYCAPLCRILAADTPDDYPGGK
jgi:hypothetical protein